MNMDHDVKDLVARRRRQGAHRVGRQGHAGARVHPRALRAREAAGRDPRVAACLHVTTETANLMRTLKAGGADIVLCASNPLSTQDDVAASLVADYGIRTYAIKGEDTETYYAHIDAAIEHRPQMTMDDGADVVGRIHAERPRGARGHHRRHRGDDDRRHPPARDGRRRRAEVPDRLGQRREHEAPLRQPLRHRAVDARRRHPRDEPPARRPHARRLRLRLVRPRRRDARRRAWAPTSSSARSTRCGARGRHGRLPRHAGRRGREAVADIWITVTGDINVIDTPAFDAMKDGAIIANSGHFNVRDQHPAPARERRRPCARSVRSSRSSPSRTAAAIYLLADGRLVNLSAAEGHPASVMDMSFANQALSAEYMVANAASLEPGVYPVPRDIDAEHRRAQARDDGRQDRRAHRRAGEVPGVLDRGDRLGRCRIDDRIPRTIWWQDAEDDRRRTGPSHRPDASAARGRRARVRGARGRVHGDPVAGGARRSRARASPPRSAIALWVDQRVRGLRHRGHVPGRSGRRRRGRSPRRGRPP